MNFVAHPSDVPAATQCEAHARVGASTTDDTWQLRAWRIASPPLLPYVEDDTNSAPYAWSHAFGPLLLTRDRTSGRPELVYQAMSGPADTPGLTKMAVVRAAVGATAATLVPEVHSAGLIVRTADSEWWIGDATGGSLVAIRTTSSVPPAGTILCSPALSEAAMLWPFLRSDGGLGLVVPGRTCAAQDGPWQPTVIPGQAWGTLVPGVQGTEPTWFAGDRWYDANTGEPVDRDDLPVVATTPRDPVLQAMVVGNPPTFVVIRAHHVVGLRTGQAPAWTFASTAPLHPGACAGDLDGDGFIEMIIPGGGPSAPFLVALDAAGTERWRAPAADRTTGLTCAVADLDGDGRREVLWQDFAGLHIVDDAGRALFDGAETAGRTTFDPPTVADIDGDGSSEVLVAATTFVDDAIVRGRLLGPIAWSSGTRAFAAHRPTWLGAYDHAANLSGDGDLLQEPPGWWQETSTDGQHLMPVDRAPCHRIELGTAKVCASAARAVLQVRNLGADIAAAEEVEVSVTQGDRVTSVRLPLAVGLAHGSTREVDIAWGGAIEGASVRAWLVSDPEACAATATAVTIAGVEP